MTTLVIQHIITSWTKESRGGQAATRRNAVPIVDRLPIPKTRAKIVVHTLNYKEEDNFLTPSSELSTDGSLPMTLDCISIKQLGPDILVSVRYNHSMGAPERGWIRKDMKVSPGEWVQILSNGRFGGDMEWLYRHEAWNIAYVAEPDARIFTHSTPKVAFSALALLH